MTLEELPRLSPIRSLLIRGNARCQSFIDEVVFERRARLLDVIRCSLNLERRLASFLDKGIFACLSCKLRFGVRNWLSVLLVNDVLHRLAEVQQTLLGHFEIIFLENL